MHKQQHHRPEVVVKAGGPRESTDCTVVLHGRLRKLSAFGEARGAVDDCLHPRSNDFLCRGAADVKDTTRFLKIVS